MTTTTYNIEGMTCNGCVASVRKNLEILPQVLSADVSLIDKKAMLELNTDVSIDELQTAIGKYGISESEQVIDLPEIEEIPEKSLTTYKPLILIIGFILLVTVLSQYPFDGFDIQLWMRHFMAGFFIVFSFFKLLNLQGFADSYSMYDIIAAKWKPWGHIYPFVELGLGLAYLMNIAPLVTNWTTLVVIGISSIGVILSVMNKRKIKCACLGDVFNLPMSTVTIIEDLTMLVMAAIMVF